MRTITTVEMNPDSREEYLPGYTPQFPHIASHIDGRLYQSDVAPWHWHESVELFTCDGGASSTARRTRNTSFTRAAAGW